LLDNLPAPALSDLAQFAHLIFDRLLVGAKPPIMAASRQRIFSGSRSRSRRATSTRVQLQ
jgi:hypothetical protein